MCSQEVGSPRGPLMRTEELLKAAGHAVVCSNIYKFFG